MKKPDSKNDSLAFEWHNSPPSEREILQKQTKPEKTVELPINILILTGSFWTLFKIACQ